MKRSIAREAPKISLPKKFRGQLAQQRSLEGSVAWSLDLAQVHRTVKGFQTHVLHPKSTRKVAHKIYMRDIGYLI